MKPSWYAWIWWLLVLAGAACMVVFLQGARQHLGWFGSGGGSAGEQLEFSQLVTLFFVMPAGLLWMGSVFPAMQMHFHTGSRRALFCTGILVMANLLTLLIGSLLI